MREQYKELQQQLNTFADWLEKANSVHCDSVPRRAANAISKLEEENYQMRLLLNKRYTSLRDLYDSYMGKLRMMIYLLEKKYGNR